MTSGKNNQQSLEKSGKAGGVERAADLFIFLGILALSALAVLALAVTAPIALAISAVTGLFEKNKPRGQWRPAGV